MRLEEIKEICIRTAKKSPMKRKYGAALVHDGRILSLGFNTYHYQGGYKLHTVPKTDFKTIHAEMMAIKNCTDKNNISKCVIYLVRINNPNSPRDPMPAPCEICTKKLKEKGIKGVMCMF